MAVPGQQMQHSLRIGDVILLHSREGRGFIFSETSSSEHVMLSVFHEVISPDNPDIPDIRMAAFKVLAPNKNTAQERLAKLRKKSSDNKNTMQLQNAEKNAKVELKNNELEQERQKGTPVLYGSVIQLLHIYSNKYVTISTVKTSKTENTNMQMYLLDHDSENCLFKILPRYKVRSVGDEVRMEDQVTFASEKTEGQYIHTSGRTYRQVGITLHENNHEVNASATESGYTIKSHYCAMPNEQDSIKGGTIIRFFHRELECYLVAEGSFANDDKVVVEEVHLRKRKSDHGKLKAPSTSAITYWQIEKDKEPLSGQVVSWGERCRIKHLPTRLYLAIIKEESKAIVREESEASVKEESKYVYRVMLKKRDINSAKSDLDTVFRLFPVIEEETEIQFNSYARINHPHTKTWLVSQKGKHYTRKGFDPKATGLDSLQWDSAELLQIGVQDQMSYDDAFTIEQIDEDLIRKFTYVAGIVPVVKAYIKELNAHPHKIGVKKVDKVQKALDELSDFIKYAHPRMKDHQKLLRNLMILEMLKRVLDKFDPDSQHASIQRRVCQACYRLMEIYLDGDSRKNENYLARFIPLFEKQVGMDLNAEQMLTEIIRDNALIVSKYGKDAVDTVIEKLIHSKDPRFFDYLGVLCVCDGRPIPENQDSIITKLVKQHGKNLFYLTKVHDAEFPSDEKKKEIYYCMPSDPPNNWHPLSQIAAKSSEGIYHLSNKEKVIATIYNLYENQIKEALPLANCHTIKETLRTYKKLILISQLPKLDMKDVCVTTIRTPLMEIHNNKNVKKNEEHEYQFQYLVSQLDLFGKLCKGNNASAVDVIDKKFNYLTFEEALVGARDSNLHPTLRSKYVELIVVLYVDVGDNRAILDNLSLSFIYTKITKDPYKSAAGDDTIALTGAVNIHFPDLKIWILEHVTKIKSVAASVIDENNLNAEVLDLLYLLVKYGYYDDLDDINSLIPSLVSLLNGKNDTPFPNANDEQSITYRQEKRFEDNYVNRAVFNLKVKALKTMDLFFNFRFYIRLQHFIYDYKLLKKEVDPDEKVEAKPDDDDEQPTQKQRRFNRFTPAQLQQLTSGITQQVSNVTHQVSHVTHQVTQHVTDLALLRFLGNTDEYPEPPDLLKTLEMNSHRLKINEPQNENLMQLAVARLSVIFSLSLFECDFVDNVGISFPEILIDLSKYENDELLHESLHLLGRIYAAEENLFEKATQTQLLITRESESVYTEVQDMLPTLRHYAAIDVNATQCKELVKILERFTVLCHLEKDENQAHKQNQKILYNTGVFSDVLDLIFRDKSSRQITSDGVEFVGNATLDSHKIQQRELILSKCLQFLRLLAKDNTVVQERLFDRMDDLLELDVAIPEMADLLSEVFTGGQEICLKIKEQQVEQVFLLIAYGGDVGRAELLGMLQSVVKVEKLDLPLKRNQAYIIKYFSKTRDMFCNDLLGLEDEKVTRRGQLLIKADNSDPNLQMLIKLIDLLASCCEGENLFIESICQNVMGISELLKILSMHDLDPIRKKPFVRFLLWVYMNTGGDKIQTGSTVLFHDGLIWNYLEHISLLLEGAVKALVNLPSSQIASAKQNLTSRATIIRRDERGFRQRAKTMSNQKNIPFVTMQDGELIPGLLIYLMEGVLPMLKVYYSEYFIPYDTSTNTTGDSAEIAPPEKEIKVSGSIAHSLMYLSEVIKKFLTSQDQWDLLHATIITITKQPCFEEYPIDIDSKVKAEFDSSIKYSVSAPNNALETYTAVYHREVLLNDEFNNFVRNYELAYWGPNTAFYQIGSMYKTTYSEFEDKFLDEKGDEWLPLGKSFQNHVKLYISSYFPEVKIQPYTKRIIDCLEASYNNLSDLDEKERQRQDKNDIRYLYILRTLIHNQIMLVDPDLKEEGQDPATYRMQSKHVTSVQNQIQALGNTVERIVKLLAHPNDKISAEVLAFLSTLLYNGNRKVQEGFSYLMQTREEKLFVSMQQRLQQAALNDRERRTLLAQLESRIESQKVLKDTYVTQTIHRTASRTPVQEVFNPEVTSLCASTDPLLDEGRKPRKLSTFSDEVDYVPAKQKLVLSGEAYEMETFKEPHGHEGRVSITDPNYSYARRKKKRLDKLTIPELLKAVESEDELGQQMIETELRKRNYVRDDHDKASSLEFKDTSYIELALRVLGLMCDGQYRPMQNYLREQPDNIKTINLVSETCVFLSSFYVDVTKDNIKLITSVLQTLIEMSVGNFANQQVLFNHQMVDTINRISQTLEVQQCSKADILELKQSAIELLEAMCEETHTGTKKLVLSIYKGVDIDALHKTLGYFYRLSQDPDMKKEDKDDDAERAAFRTYHVLVHMADFEGISISDVDPKMCGSKNRAESKCDMEIKEAWNYCHKWSKSVEVIYENEDDQKVLAKVHFRSYPSDEIPEELIEKVKYRVNRESPEDKTRDFLKWMEGAKKEILHLTTLRRHWYTNIFIYNIKWRNYLLIFWTLLMNILLMIAWSDQDISLKMNVVYTPPENETISSMLSDYCVERLCHNNSISNSAFSPEDCMDDYCMRETAVPTTPNIDNGHWFFDYFLYIGGGIHLSMSLAMVISYFLINSGNFVLPDFVFKYILQKKDRVSTYSDEPLFGIRSLYHIVFVACSALSLPFYGYFYCVCLLHIVIDNDILQRVLKSVTKNGRSLLWVGALGLVILYIYSVGTFAFLPNEFHEPDPEEDGDNVRFCQSLVQCFISVLEYGLLDTLGLTADLPMNFRDAALRTVFYDLTFFIIVTTIGLNIVFGIIVDTFSELRDERWRIEEDKKGTCFICSIASYEFERRAKGFNHHVKHEHCMWDYIYFYLHLDRIDVSDHNALESYAYHQIKDEKTDFFPLFNAKSLKASADETLTQLNEVKDMVAEILEHFHREERVAALRRRREEQAQWERENITEDQ